MARTRQWGDDSSTQIKFSGGGSVSLIFKGNLFDLLPHERILITELSDVIQRFNIEQAQEISAEPKRAE